jgi:hypothetical protein
MRINKYFKNFRSYFTYHGQSKNVYWAIHPFYSICKFIGLCCIGIQTTPKIKLRVSRSLLYYSVTFFVAYVGEFFSEIDDLPKLKLGAFYCPLKVC